MSERAENEASLVLVETCVVQPCPDPSLGVS